MIDQSVFENKRRYGGYELNRLMVSRLLIDRRGVGMQVDEEDDVDA